MYCSKALLSNILLKYRKRVCLFQDNVCVVSIVGLGGGSVCAGINSGNVHFF